MGARLARSHASHFVAPLPICDCHPELRNLIRVALIVEGSAFSFAVDLRRHSERSKESLLAFCGCSSGPSARQRLLFIVIPSGRDFFFDFARKSILKRIHLSQAKHFSSPQRANQHVRRLMRKKPAPVKGRHIVAQGARASFASQPWVPGGAHAPTARGEFPASLPSCCSRRHSERSEESLLAFCGCSGGPSAR